MSLPSRERGLKYLLPCILRVSSCVAPLAGARIEIWLNAGVLAPVIVAPLAGARIEIIIFLNDSSDNTSLPSRERGLK